MANDKVLALVLVGPQELKRLGPNLIEAFPIADARAPSDVAHALDRADDRVRSEFGLSPRPYPRTSAQAEEARQHAQIMLDLQNLCPTQRLVLGAVRLGQALDGIDGCEQAITSLMKLGLVECSRCGGAEIPICTDKGTRLARHLN
jgi:hypothetical protein